MTSFDGGKTTGVKNWGGEKPLRKKPREGAFPTRRLGNMVRLAQKKNRKARRRVEWGTPKRGRKGKKWKKRERFLMSS